MRQKTEEKRQQILRVASQLFMQHDFESVSMSQIATLVGGSKATLYNYFSDKEELFIEVVLTAARHMAGKAFSVLDQSMPLFAKLSSFGKKYVMFILSDDMVSLRRNIFTHYCQEKIGREVYERGMHNGWQRVSALIEAAMEKGELKRADAWLAAMQLKSLFELDLIDRRMVGLDKEPGAKVIARNVEEGLRLFLNTYKA